MANFRRRAWHQRLLVVPWIIRQDGIRRGRCIGQVPWWRKIVWKVPAGRWIDHGRRQRRRWRQVHCGGRRRRETRVGTVARWRLRNCHYSLSMYQGLWKCSEQNHNQDTCTYTMTILDGACHFSAALLASLRGRNQRAKNTGET